MNTNNELNIIVAGGTASGKSTVAMIIKEALKERGFDVNFDGGKDYKNENEFDQFLKKNQEERIEQLTGVRDIKISLSELSVNRKVRDEL